MTMTINPFVDGFLTLYSQSDRSTGGTRGYDPETYVETKLDRNLIPRILDPKTKLVILTGNAGDGKTAFIQHVEKLAEDQDAEISKRTGNCGTIFRPVGGAGQSYHKGAHSEYVSAGSPQSHPAFVWKDEGPGCSSWSSDRDAYSKAE